MKSATNAGLGSVGYPLGSNKGRIDSIKPWFRAGSTPHQASSRRGQAQGHQTTTAFVDQQQLGVGFHRASNRFRFARIELQAQRGH